MQSVQSVSYQRAIEAYKFSFSLNFFPLPNLNAKIQKKLLSPAFMQRVAKFKSWLNQCTDLSNATKQPAKSLRHLLKCLHLCLRYHYADLKRNGDFSHSGLSDYYFWQDEDSDCTPLLGFNRKAFFSRLGLWLAAYEDTELAECLAARLIYVLDQLTEQRYDLSIEEGFLRAYGTFALMLAQKKFKNFSFLDFKGCGVDESQFPQDCNFEVTEFLGNHSLYHNSIEKKINNFTRQLEYPGLEQEKQTLVKILNSLVDRIKDDTIAINNLTINLVCAITLNKINDFGDKTPDFDITINKFCAVSSTSNGKCVINFYESEELIFYFKAKYKNDLKDYSDETVVCPKNNKISTLTFLNLRQLIEIIQLNLPQKNTFTITC